MKINAEFDQAVIVHSAEMAWLDSPMSGVCRRPLDRVGGEIARATSVVRYAPGSHFSPHVHTGGEEFLVLNGVFQDEHGDFPAGSYIRNPPESKHKPGSELGCTILVKLWQFDPGDRIHVRLNWNFMQAVPHRYVDNVSVIPLYADQYEEVSIQQWSAKSVIDIEAARGLEVFVLDGAFYESGNLLKAQSWLRLPVGSKLKAQVGDHGARVWIKQGHLDRVDGEVCRINDLNA